MAQHADAAGADLHDPKGVSPTPIVAPKNDATSYQIQWDSDGAGGADRDVIVARTTDGNIGLVLGNTSEVWPIEVINAQIQVDEIAAPGTPAAGKVAVYAKTDGKLYIKDDAGTETDLTGGGGGAGSDTTAIHDNTSSEISAITAKASPTTSDYLIIEDAAAGNAKKSITIGDLPASGLDEDQVALLAQVFG